MDLVVREAIIGRKGESFVQGDMGETVLVELTA